MKFTFRADASLQIGSGHIMRCLTLANALRKQGHSVQFITRAHSGHLRDFVAQQGFECVLLPENVAQSVSGSLQHAAWLGTTQAQDFADCLPYLIDFQPDWIVCDHYALSAEWERAAVAALGAGAVYDSDANLILSEKTTDSRRECEPMRSIGKYSQRGSSRFLTQKQAQMNHKQPRLLVIDDLHDREHVADVLLDQNLGHTAADYVDLISENRRMLAGARYALLRDEFAAWRDKSLARRMDFSGLQNVLINLGGVDKDNITLKILKSLAENFSGSLNVTAVMGATAPHIATVREFAEHTPFTCQVLVNVQNMAQLMAQADWAIGAAGSTSWERCCVGLPTVMLVLADNQRTIAEQLQQVGAAVAFDVGEIGSEKWLACLHDFRQPENLQIMSANAAALCDGLGAVRVVNHIMELSQNQVISTIRAAQLDDCHGVFEWRNHADIRRFMFNPDKLIWENHAAWFSKQLHNPDFKMLIYLVNNQPKGYVSFTRLPEKAWEWGFYTAPDCERGHGTKMARLALAWAFAELGAARIVGQVLSYNAASLRLHEKLGFCRFHSTSDETQPEKHEVAQFELWAQEFGY
ncbi:UDP-2,4-diacetamido-2,4,6-trideoxy-beta-L-altropyranose hydrolase [Neisseriaceae bacterium B1]